MKRTTQISSLDHLFPLELRSSRAVSLPQEFPGPFSRPEELIETAELAKAIEDIDKGLPVTVVSVPSLSFPKESLKGIEGIKYYQGRSLWQLEYLKRPHTKIIFVTSLEFDESELMSLLRFLPDPLEARSRIQLIQVSSDDQLSLAESLISDKEALRAIKKMTSGQTCFLDPFISTSLEREVAQELEIPVLGPRISHKYWMTKSGNRKIMKMAGVPLPAGIEDLKGKEQLVPSLEQLWASYQFAEKILVKHEEGVSGKGNAILDLKIKWEKYQNLLKSDKKLFWDERIASMELSKDLGEFLDELENGFIVELFVEGKIISSPSCQGFIYPEGRVDLLSTHEQILDETGMIFKGALFPAKGLALRRSLQNSTMEIGKSLSRRGVFGAFSVDFLVSKTEHGTHVNGLEINLRRGGTTHPQMIARLATGAQYCHKNGILIDAKNRPVYYRSEDNFINENLKVVGITGIHQWLSESGFEFDSETNSGIIPYMTSSIPSIGKMGYLVVGESRRLVTQLEGNFKKALGTRLKN